MSKKKKYEIKAQEWVIMYDGKIKQSEKKKKSVSNKLCIKPSSQQFYSKGGFRSKDLSSKYLLNASLNRNF